MEVCDVAMFLQEYDARFGKQLENQLHEICIYIVPEIPHS